MVHQRQFIAAIATLLLLLGAFAPGNAAAATFDTLYQGGTIYTMTDLFKDDGTADFTKVKNLDPDNAITVEVVAVDGGKIVFAGSAEDAQAQGYTEENAAKVVDLNGKTMLPGFIDGHGHYPQQGTIDLFQVFLGSNPLGNVNTLDQLVEAIDEACQDDTRFPDGVIGANYDDTLLDINRHPTWEDLEKASSCSSKPVVIKHISGHMKVANKKALVDAGVMNNDGSPGDNARDSSGNLINGVVVEDNKITGLLQETVAMALVDDPDLPSDTQLAIARANDVYLAAGVTTVDLGADMTSSVSNMQQALDEGRFTTRAVWHPYATGAYAAYNLYEMYYTGVDAAGNYALIYPQELANSEAAPDFGNEGPTATQGKTPRIGQDITLWQPKDDKMGARYTFNNEGSVPTERLFQGAYKILGDGSPQGYTAWLKSPGYYDWGSYTAEDSATWNAKMYSDGDNGALVGTKYHDEYAMVGPDGTIENVPPGDMHSLIDFFHRNGISTEVHTNGTGCAEVWIEALEMAVTKYPEITDTRHTSIHAQTLERQHIQRLMGDYANVDTNMAKQMWGWFTDNAYKTDDDPAWAVLQNTTMNKLADNMAAQNLFASFFVNHVYYYGERHSNIFFGPGRANNISPTGWATAYSLPFSFHNDTAITPIEPLLSIQTAVTRLSAANTISDGGVLISGSGTNLDATVNYPSRVEDGVKSETMTYYDYDQRINVLQALLAHTVSPAWQNKLEDRIGSIQVGHAADFVILDDDPMTVASEKASVLGDIRVSATIVGDTLAYGVLPGDSEYLYAVKASYHPSAENDMVSSVSVELYDETTADQRRSLPEGLTRYGMFELTVTATDTGTPLMQFNTLGNGSKASEFQMYNVTTSTDFSYGEDFKNENAFWFAAADDPLTPLSSSAELQMDQDYIVYFTLKVEENTNTQLSTLSAIAPLSGTQAEETFDVTTVLDFTTSGTVPNNYSPVDTSSSSGGGSGGCTVGTTPDYGMIALFVMLVGILGVRSVRRRACR